MISPLVDELDHALESLTAALSNLDTQLRQAKGDMLGALLSDSSPESFPLSADPATLSTLCNAYQAVTYTEGHTDGRHVVTCPGVLALPGELISGPIAEVNAAKAAFEAAAQSINSLYVDHRGALVDKANLRLVTWMLPKASYSSGLLPEGVYPLIRYHLAVIGCANLNLRQLWRQIHILSDADQRPPNRLGFTWLHKRNVSRVLAADIRKKLNGYEGQDSTAIRDAQFRMSEVSDHEWLARIQEIPPQLQLTGIWGAPRQSTNHRKTVLAVIPVVIPMDERVSSIMVHRPSNIRHSRRRSKIEEAPLIDFLNIYRYQPGMRTYDDASGADDE